MAGKKMKTYSLDQVKNKVVGKKGSLEREIYEQELELNIQIKENQQRELFKSFLEKVVEEIEVGDLTWQTRDEAKELLKLFNCG